MVFIVVCDNCGSEKRLNRRCEACLDRTDEEWALHDAREAFAAGEIDAGELERRIERALSDPPRRLHPHLIYR